MPPWYITPFQHWKILINFLKSYYGFLYWCSLLYLHCFRSFPPPLLQSTLTPLHCALYLLATCTGFATPKNVTQKRTRRPRGLNSPKLCWGTCLVFLLQAQLLLAAPLEGAGSSKAGGCCPLQHQALGTRLWGCSELQKKQILSVEPLTCLFVLSLRIWLVYPKETTNQQHTWTE